MILLLNSVVTASESSLRYAMRLISAAALVAARRKSNVVEPTDIKRVYGMFVDTQRSAQFLLEQADAMMFATRDTHAMATDS